jgi:hypothetical protein
MRKWRNGYRCVWPVVVAGLWLSAVPCQAQGPVGEDAKSQAGAEPSAGPASESRTPPSKPATPDRQEANPPMYSGDLRYLIGPDGRAVAVPDKATLDEFRKWLAQRNSQESETPPAASITSLALDGTAGDERILLTARIGIQLSANAGWVRVPLAMSEAALRAAPLYRGPGLAVPAAYHPDEGYAWWIKGAGQHELEVPLSIPVRKQSTQNRLQLSVPATAVSMLKLHVPASRVTAKVSPEGPQLSNRTVNQGTDLEVIGLGNRLDLTWQALPDSSSAETPLEVTSTIVATLVDGEAATLETSQRIQSLGQQGTFDELRVSLPAGYELLRLDGYDHRPDPANPNQMIVQLKKPTVGPVELKWTVRTRLPAVGESFSLEGFEVERARLQTGFLAVVVVGDFRIVRQPDDDKFLQRIDPADLPGTLRPTPATAAFRFLNRLQMRMKLQRIEPYVTVDPAVLLNFSSDSAELEGICRLRVLRGSIGSFRLRWPHWKQQGWTITEAELPDHVDLRVTEDSTDPDQIRLEFPEPMKGTIDVRFRARRLLASTAERISLTLPVAEAYHRFPRLLAVLSADNVEIDLQPGEMTALRPLTVPVAEVAMPADWQNLRRADYRLESVASDLTAVLSVHPRRIQAATAISASIRSSAVAIRQNVTYDVAYERIAQLRFSVPEGIAPEQIRFFTSTGRELPQLVIPTGDRTPPELRVTLETPAIGRFEVEARFALPRQEQLPEAGETIIAIPILHSLDVGYGESRFACRDASGREALVRGEAWTRRLAPDGSPLWTSSQTPAAVVVSITRAGGFPNGTQVSKTLIRTVITPTGAILGLAQYRLVEGISEFSVAFPAGIEPKSFWWNRRELYAVPSTSSADGTTHYEVDFSGGPPSRDHLLTIEFQSQTRGQSRLGAAITLDSPKLPDELRAAQVYWQVVLPAQQLLFTQPEGCSLESYWRSGRPFWTREPTLSTEELQNWVGSEAGPTMTAAGGGNGYLFATFGNAPRLTFRAMSQSTITLIGAGTALALGWILLYWPVTRHILTVFAAMFSIALLGVFYRTPVEVLLQPAAIGVFLAGVGAAIQRRIRRRSRLLAVTLASHSGFMTPASSHQRSPALVTGIGSNEFTSIRPAPEPAAPAGQLSESGSRL